MWVSTLSPCSFYPAFPLSLRRPSRSHRTSDTRPTSCERARPSPSRPTISLALSPRAADSSPVLGCFVFLPRPTGSIKTTKCCLSIRWYAHSWSTTLLWHSPGTGLPTLSRLSFSLSLSLPLSLFVPPLACCSVFFLSASPPSSLFSSFYRRISVFMGVRFAS